MLTDAGKRRPWDILGDALGGALELLLGGSWTSLGAAL